MTLKLNDKVKMLKDTEWWHKNDIGRIVRIDHGDSYLICFNEVCTKDHDRDYGNHWFASQEDFELYRPNRLMKVE